MGKNVLIISFLQAWGIILVVIGHSTEVPVIYPWIYSFHMPLFMFISGYLLCHGIRAGGLTFEQKVLSSGFLLKKVRRLLVPYVAISTAALFPKVLLGRFAMRPVNFSFGEWWHMLVYPGDNVIIFFWFLPTIFLIFSVVRIGGGYLHKLGVPLYICLATSLVFHLFNPLKEVRLLNLSGVLSYLFYFILGYWTCRNDVAGFFSRRPATYLLVSIMLDAMFFALPDFFGRDVLLSVDGIALSIALGTLYIRSNCRLLDHLYGSSYAIYLFSWFPQVLSRQVLVSLTGIPLWVGSVLAFITGLYLPLLIYRWTLSHSETRTGRILAFVSGMQVNRR
jgi:hypothetical protein